MKRFAKLLLVTMGLTVGWVNLATAQLPMLATVTTERVTATLMAERPAIAPGETIWVGLRLQMDEGWHSYWRNPGDSGLPTMIDWSLPDGLAAGPIQWPAPERQPFPSITCSFAKTVLSTGSQFTTAVFL